MKKTPKSERQEAPFDDFGLVMACRNLHWSIDQLDANIANSVGISRNDLRCLNLLERSAVSPSQIAKALDLTSGSVTTLLDRLESAGFIERSPSPTDRRALLVTATPKCFDAIGPMYKQFALSLIDYANGLSKEQRAIVIDSIEHIASLCSNTGASKE